MKRSYIKRKAPKTSAIRRSAKGEECTINLYGVCSHQTETVVLCHENGGGMGMKTPDENGAYGCHACHMVVDMQHPLPAWLTRDYVNRQFELAQEKTRQKLIAKGLIK